MLNTFKKICDGESCCISIIVDGMKSLMAMSNSTKFKKIENIFMYNVSAAICLHLGRKLLGFWVLSFNSPFQQMGGAPFPMKAKDD